MLSLQTVRYFNSPLSKVFRCCSLEYSSRALFSQAFDTNKDYYKILGVAQGATDKQIKAAYFELAKKYHPDVNKGNADRFKEISDAYSVIGDDKKRKDYDAARKFSSGATGFGGNRTSQGQQYGGFGGYGQNQGYGNNQQYQQQNSYYYYNSNTKRDPRAEQEEEMLKSYFKSYYGMQFQDFVNHMNKQVHNERARKENSGFKNFQSKMQGRADSNQYYWDSKQAETEYRKQREEEYRRMEQNQRIRKQKEVMTD